MDMSCVTLLSLLLFFSFFSLPLQCIDQVPNGIRFTKTSLYIVNEAFNETNLSAHNHASFFM